MRKRSFSLYEHDSKLLLRSRLSDLGSHLRVIVAPEEDNATDGKLSQLTKSTFSINAGKPVMFVMDGGARTEFWTKGFLHCPWDAAIRIRTPNRESAHYNDSDGISHRIGGPAETSYLLDSGSERYEEYWRIDGKQHREDGPSSTAIMKVPRAQKTWGSILNLHEWEQHIDLFPASTPIKYTTTLDTNWCRHGEPYRENDGYTSLCETGIVEVTQISELLGIRNVRICVRQEFNWRNDRGELHRVDGPAIVKLHGSCEITQNGKMVDKTYEGFSTAWYYDGFSMNNTFVHDWVEDNDIGIGEEPFIDNSYFASAEDETCFLMDVIAKFSN